MSTQAESLSPGAGDDCGQPSLVVLAGGLGTRLGQDKAALVLDDEMLVQRVIRRASGICDDTTVVLRRDQYLELPQVSIVYDTLPHAGALAGLEAGLAAAQRAWALVLACDLPFVSADLLGYMLSLRPGHEVVMPRLPVGDEPLHALYHKACLPALRAALARGAKRLNSFVGGLRVRYVSQAEIERYGSIGHLFFNVNTEQDLAVARTLLSSSPVPLACDEGCRSGRAS